LPALYKNILPAIFSFVAFFSAHPFKRVFAPFSVYLFLLLLA
jgi:hypothetical protein